MQEAKCYGQKLVDWVELVFGCRVLEFGGVMDMRNCKT